MESPAGGSAAAEPAPPGAEPELAAGGPAEAEAAEAGSAAPRPRCLRAVYVLNDPPKAGAGARSPEAGARQCLLRACEAEGAQLSTVNFGELDFGETAVLDAFYDAGHSMARGVFALNLKRCIYHRIQKYKEKQTNHLQNRKVVDERLGWILCCFSKTAELLGPDLLSVCGAARQATSVVSNQALHCVIKPNMLKTKSFNTPVL